MALSPQQKAAMAHKAMQEGRFDDARPLLDDLRRLAPNDGTVRLMSAYLARAQGRVDDAIAEFANACRLKPQDAFIQATYASYLQQLGRHDDAIKYFDMALKNQPNMIDAVIDRALIIARHKDRGLGISILNDVIKQHPQNVRAMFNLAIYLKEDGDLNAAKTWALHILSLQADHFKAAILLAQIAFDKGEDAADLFQNAAKIWLGQHEKQMPDTAPIISQQPEYGSIILSHATAKIRQGDVDGGINMVDNILDKDPDWADGHFLRSQILWQMDKGEEALSSYIHALEKNPMHIGLWGDYINSAGRILGYEQAAEIGERALQKFAASDEESRRLLHIEIAKAQSELGQYDAAISIFEQYAPHQNANHQLAFLRALTLAQQYDRADKIADNLIAWGQGAHAWPYKSIIWRMTSNPKAAWLERDGELAVAQDLPFDDGELQILGEYLRDIHYFKVQPFNQSLRGGTQTDANSLLLNAPPIQKLKAKLDDAVRHYIDQLPAFDAAHPLLGQARDHFRYTGSWSVLLSPHGFHVNHIHSQGQISSAFYVDLPASINGDSGQDGWLCVGEPAQEFKTNLTPLKMIEPKAGRLALFPSWMWHGTRPFADGTRLTVAFDIGLYK
ncbi:hypothetical protein LPB140_11740 [Sphingorhabdus lutea]|uniref:Uncharacterized protein n=1 Tax=Sphingorhabdus lutea TaxID=1913578 RepID=A0A1L3JDX6_9SPHN|nr:putative 2OG-Fe(II) oxygenase [Sphingorhabdus lutea]APG63348.1 hypothetical protein LPB140_11740 [Sphingorhabdus lutea]